MAEDGHESVGRISRIVELTKASRCRERDNERCWGRNVRYPYDTQAARMHDHRCDRVKSWLLYYTTSLSSM